jgi:hypothetical protein
MKPSETIFNGKYNLVPMADVCFISYENDKKDSANVVMKNTQWSNYLTHGYDGWLNALYLQGEELREFEKAYCQYRYEIDIKVVEE